jgi:hypothetical protein
VGDSHAGHYAPVLGSFFAAQNMLLEYENAGACTYLPGACLLDPTFVKLVQSSWEERALQTTYSTIILGGKWRYYSAHIDVVSVMRGVVAKLIAAKKKVVILGEVAVFPHFSKDCPMKRPSPTDGRFESCLRKESLLLDMKLNDIVPFPLLNDQLESLASEFAGAQYWDPNLFICTPLCSPYLRDGTRLYLDQYSHLDMEAGHKFALEIMESFGIPQPFRVQQNRSSSH